MEAGISGSKRVVIGDAGHLMYPEKPAEFSYPVIGFIESNRCCGGRGNLVAGILGGAALQRCIGD
jgi:hypothetical protein